MKTDLAIIATSSTTDEVADRIRAKIKNAVQRNSRILFNANDEDIPVPAWYSARDIIIDLSDLPDFSFWPDMERMTMLDFSRLTDDSQVDTLLLSGFEHTATDWMMHRKQFTRNSVALHVTQLDGSWFDMFIVNASPLPTAQTAPTETPIIRMY